MEHQHPGTNSPLQNSDAPLHNPNEQPNGQTAGNEGQQDLEALEQEHGMHGSRQGNSSIPMDEEDLNDNDNS